MIQLISHPRSLIIKMSGWGSPKQLFQFFMAILLILDVSAILLNGLIVYVLKKHKKTSIVTFWFIYCLSISDVMVGVSGLFFHLVQLKMLLGSLSPVWISLLTASLSCLDYFLMTSGHLIFFTAIDRCIHMKYLNKYRTIMTKSKARWIILFNAIFCILIAIPRLVASKEFVARFYLGINIFHATFILLIYAIYAKIYFSIKRHISSLQTCKTSHTNLHNHTDKRNAGQSAAVKEHHCSRCLETKLCVANSSATKENSFKPCVFGKDEKALEPLEDAFVLPNCAESGPTILIRKYEKTNDIERRQPAISSFFKNEMTHPVGQENLDRGKRKASLRAEKTQLVDGKFSTTSLAQKATPEQDFRKATLFIFLALFICYFPNISYYFYEFATKDRNALFSYISQISVLLNSSLNAIILISFSKEMQRHVKAIFVKNTLSSLNNRR